MNIIGLDLSLTNTGYVILNCEGVILESGVIKSKKNGVKRLAEISETIGALVDMNNIAFAIIEGYAFSPNGGRSFSIGELGGVIKSDLHDYYVPFYVVAPTSLKKFATGKGNAPKSHIEKEVYKRWNVEFKTEHEIDAYVLARIGLSICNKGKYELTKWQKDVIKVVLEDKGKRNWKGGNK